MKRQLVWRLVRDGGETAECYAQPTPSGALGITILRGSDATLAALATDLETARRLVADRKIALLRDGWGVDYEDPAW